MMKKFDMFIDGSKIDTLTEEDIKKQLKKEPQEKLLNLKVGESEFFETHTPGGFKTTFEYERVL